MSATDNPVVPENPIAAAIDAAEEIHDPLEGHKKLLSVYTDKEIHDVTAYLVTVK